MAWKLRPWASLVKKHSCRSALVNSTSALDRSLTLLLQHHSHKTKNFNVLTAILSDISDDSDMNFIYILSANEYQHKLRNNDRKNTLKQTKHQTKSQFAYELLGHVTKAVGIKAFYQ